MAPRRLLALVAAVAAGALVGCGSAGPSSTTHASAGRIAAHRTHRAAGAATTASGTSTAAAVAVKPKPKPVSTVPVDRFPPVLTPRWRTISTIAGRPALWIAERGGVTLVRMNQSLVHLALHAGSEDPGGTGWHYGDRVAGGEIHHLVLGFNGGFKINTNAGGFESFGRIGVPLVRGVGSIVTYRNGQTQIGPWDEGVPAPRRLIASVRQNLSLLIEHGRPAASVSTCGSNCWGATIGGLTAVARSGLGTLANGQLLWAAGEGLTVGQFAHAMVAAGVQTGVQLDINPDWVAGYLYIHHRTGALTPVPVVPGQYGIYGHLLSPYTRDFFTVLSN